MCQRVLLCRQIVRDRVNCLAFFAQFSRIFAAPLAVYPFVPHLPSQGVSCPRVSRGCCPVSSIVLSLSDSSCGDIEERREEGREQLRE